MQGVATMSKNNKINSTKGTPRNDRSVYGKTGEETGSRVSRGNGPQMSFSTHCGLGKGKTAVLTSTPGDATGLGESQELQTP